MRKITSFLLIITFLFSIIRFNSINALIIGPDFNVKIRTNSNETYTTNLSNIGSGSILDFKVVSIITDTTTTGTYAINLPSGFIFNSYSLSDNNCGFELLSSTNNSFKYKYSHSGSICESIVTFKYTISSSAQNGTHTISLLDSINSIKAQLNINILNSNYINRAQTLDINNNGYIDAYLLNLANINNISSLSGVIVAGVSTGNYYQSGSQYILPFTDNIYNTGELPQISGIFDGINITNTSINEEDLAKPIITKINSTLLSDLGNRNLNIGTGNLLLEFSENLIPASTSNFTLKYGTNNISGTFAFIQDDFKQIQFTPSSPLIAGTYTIIANSGAKDWSSNSNTVNVVIPTLIVTDTENPYGLELGTGTGIIINNGANLTNNNLVNLTINAYDNVGINQMIISNDNSFSGATWEPYLTSKFNWNIGSNNGIKTVYIKFKDINGNISEVYSDNINYSNTNNYINFSSIDSIYTNNSIITLTGTCNYISNTGSILGTILSGSVNGVDIGTLINCNSQTWTANFNLNTNSDNLIRLEFSNNTSIYNELNIINPIPSCIAPSNGTIIGGSNYPNCDFVCNTGYTKQGLSCIPKSALVPNKTFYQNYRTFNISGFRLYYNSPVIKTSNTVTISHGYSTLNVTYTLASDGINYSTTNLSESISCESGYLANGTSCIKINTGGGGGGGGFSVPTCTNTMLKCSLYNGKYIYTLKTGYSCKGGNFGLSCTPNISGTGTTSTGTNNTGGGTGTDITSTGTIIPDIIKIVKNDGTIIYFKDISKNFALNYIIELAKNGIVGGYNDNTFRPNNNTSRIEFLKILLRGLDKEYLHYSGQKNPFWDVPDDSWQSRIVIKALELGIITQNKYFYPDKTISREEAMKMLIRTSGMNIVSVENSSFDDSNGWAKNYIETAYKNGIINGQTINGNFVFRPLDNITRAEVAKLIIRTIEFIKK